METKLTFQIEENMDALRGNLIFSGLSDEEITAFLRRANPEYLMLGVGETMHVAPDSRHRLGVVLSGNVLVFSIGYDGDKALINAVNGEGTVGTMQFMMQQYNTVFEITATAESRAILMMPETLLIANDSIATVQHKVLVNLMASQRQLFLDLSQHVVCLSQKTIRGKILRFLKLQSDKARSYCFDIPYTREEMAVYLAVDRASLSRSLGELRREGVIAYNKNHFEILSTKHFIY